MPRTSGREHQGCGTRNARASSGWRVSAPVASEPWRREAAAVASELDTDVHRGLTSAEAAFRLERYGPNELDAATVVPAWRKLLGQFDDPLIYLLLGAVVISVVAWATEGAEGVPYEAIVIAVIVILNAVLGYVQEARAERAVAALQRMAAATAGVVRDGLEQRVAGAEIVPGDVLMLAEGDAVSADARLVDAASLTVAEASLTGESEAVLKDVAPLTAPSGIGDRLNMVFNGTAVTRGRGRAVVTATGMATEMGNVARLLGTTAEQRTPLQREVDRIGRALGLAVVVIAVVVIGAILLTTDMESASDLVDVLLVGVSLAVAAVPEGLPAVLSVVLALGVQRMARRHAIVKKLSSVETLGSASVVCADKTGTLTKNEMTIKKVVSPSGEVDVTGSGYRPKGELHAAEGRLDDVLLEEVRAVIVAGSLANDAVLREDEGEWAIQGDPTEGAFLVAEAKIPGLREARESRFERVGEVPFTSERKLMSTVQADLEGELGVAVVTKGAPDVLLGRCTAERVAGKTRPLTEARRRAVVDRHRPSRGPRPSHARRRLPTAARRCGAAAGRVDRAGARVPRSRRHHRPAAARGTGGDRRGGRRRHPGDHDHRRPSPHGRADRRRARDHRRGVAVLTGNELEQLDDERAWGRRPRYRGLRARGTRAQAAHRRSPAGGRQHRRHDRRRRQRRACAQVGRHRRGDGRHRHRRDEGGGRHGPRRRRLRHDRRRSREGRGIFANIRKFLRFLLSSNVGEVLMMFFGVVLAGFLGLEDTGDALAVPLLATQILWINLLTDTAPALAMGLDPPPDDVMSRPPRRLTDRVIDGEMWLGIFWVGFVMAAVTLVALDLHLSGGLIGGSGDIDEARTMAFTTLVLAQLFNCFNARSDRTSAFHHLFTNRWLWGAVAISVLLQVAVVELSFLNNAFGTTPLALEDWLICLGLASVVLWADEAKKLAERRLRR